MLGSSARRILATAPASLIPPGFTRGNLLDLFALAAAKGSLRVSLARNDPPDVTRLVLLNDDGTKRMTYLLRGNVLASKGLRVLDPAELARLKAIVAGLDLSYTQG